MKNIYKYILFVIVLLYFENKAIANDVYFIDFAKVMNESKAGKKAQDFLKKELINSNKKFNDTAKKLKEDENKIVSQKNVLRTNTPSSRRLDATRHHFI